MLIVGAFPLHEGQTTLLADVLSSDGLVLRPLAPATDASALHAVFGERSQLTYMLRGPTRDVAETRALLLRWAEDRKSPQWAITRDGGEAVGRFTLVHKRDGVLEVGLQVVPASQRQGLATRAIVLATQHAFDQKAAVRVFADIDPDNVGCVRAFERAGYEHEGLLRANWVVGDDTFDSVIMAKLAW